MIGARRLRKLALGAVGLVSLGAPSVARAAGAEVSGVVRDERGVPVVGADVVVTAAGGGQRQVAISDDRGAFRLLLADPGSHDLVVYTARGALVQRHLVKVSAGGRLHLQLGGAVTAGALSTGVVTTGGPPATAAMVSARALPWLTSRLLGAASLAQGRDLAGALAAVPGSPPSPAPGDGPLLLGTVPGEVEVRLAGLSLNDPVDGRAPWQLPVSLWSEVLPHPGLGPTVDGDRGAAGVDLLAARASRRRSAQLQVGGGAALAAAARGGRPDGAAYAGFAEGQAEVTSASGAWRGTLAVAPTRGGWQADPSGLGTPRARRTSMLPVLGRLDGERGPWTLTGTGLVVHHRQSLARGGEGGSILLPEEPTAHRHTLALAGITARRSLGPGPSEASLTAGMMTSRRQDQPLIGQALRTAARRLTLSARLRGEGQLAGSHLLSVATGLEADAADRRADGGAPLISRQAGRVLAKGEASSTTPFLAMDDHYRPVPALELQAGLRAQRISLRGQGQGTTGAEPERSFATDYLWAPRVGVTVLPFRSGRWGQSRLSVVAGRFGARLPLAPLLDVTAGPRVGVGHPAEDAGIAKADLIAERWSLSLAALERRQRNAIEDRFSPVDGQLELFAPVLAQRRYRALWAELRGERWGVRGALAIIRASLRGNHLGWLDGASGVTRPASTEAFDTPLSEVNRNGPLALDRRYGLRLLLEHGGRLGPSLRLEGALAGRIDDGTPLGALAPNPENPQSRVYLVEAGSLGRSRRSAAVDAALGLGWTGGGWKGSLRLEVLNVGDRRRALGADDLYTDVPALPTAGARGSAGLAAAMGADRSPVLPRSRHGNPGPRAEPLSMRLVLGLAF